MHRPLKRPRDPFQLAKLVGDISTGQVEDRTPDDGKDPAAIERGRLGGLKGGIARKKSLSQRQRQEIAKKGAKARWKKR
jgi:hypothetical protein